MPDPMHTPCPPTRQFMSLYKQCVERETPQSFPAPRHSLASTLNPSMPLPLPQLHTAKTMPSSSHPRYAHTVSAPTSTTSSKSAQTIPQPPTNPSGPIRPPRYHQSAPMPQLDSGSHQIPEDGLSGRRRRSDLLRAGAMIGQHLREISK